MKILPLSKGKVAIVDDNDFETVNQWKWSVVSGGSPGLFYAARHIKIDGQWKHIRLHRFILNAPKHLRVDHRDGDGLNNRRSNLRFATHQENLRNMRIHTNRTYKGVKLFPRYRFKKWQARIGTGQRMISLGFYHTVKEAAQAYNQAALKFFGEFARLNKI